MANPRHELGRRAEARVAEWLAARGWTVLARRWRGGGRARGEVDLVCLDSVGALVAVEVKLRRSRRAGSGEEAVDRRRVARLRAALSAYAAAHPGSSPTGPPPRVDLVTLSPAGAGRWRLRRTPGVDAW
ncbi:MAG TPA: YraN family protein [Candidatus Limnocylindria bacterium]|nr:YraN family protein [Candidatus Limnocylindria bacterium]